MANIEVTFNLDKIGRGLNDSVLREVTRQTILLQNYIKENKLQGQVLHHRTGNLSRAIIYSIDDKRTSGAITGTVGVGREAWYGKVHEYGGIFSVREQLRVSRRGKEYTVREHLATFPERSFMRTGLEDRRSAIIEGIGQAVQRSFQ